MGQALGGHCIYIYFNGSGTISYADRKNDITTINTICIVTNHFVTVYLSYLAAGIYMVGGCAYERCLKAEPIW